MMLIKDGPQNRDDLTHMDAETFGWLSQLTEGDLKELSHEHSGTDLGIHAKVMLRAKRKLRGAK